MSEKQKRITITKDVLQGYLARGLTAPQMAEEFEKDYGETRTASAFATQIRRYGLKTAHPAKKYDDLIPWKVSIEHSMKYDVRMLRAYGAVSQGREIAKDEHRRMEAWLAMLEENDLVVAYDPETLDGFFRVPRRPEDDPNSIIRKPDIA